MAEDSLQDFAGRIRTKRRLGKYDVQALREAILADGLQSRDDADLLIALDREVDSVHFSWAGFFIPALVEFAVWRSGRRGYIDEDKARWLLSRLTGEGASDRASR